MNGITHYVEPIPGSTVVAYLGHFSPMMNNSGKWAYSLWDEPDKTKDADLIAVGEFPPGTFEGIEVTPNQVARIAFILEVEYNSS